MNICIICCYEENRVALLPCGHKLHQECIKMLIKTRNRKCPYCRRLFNPMHYLFISRTDTV